MYRRYYNLIILLLCVGAFPIQVVALTNYDSSDSSICHFHSESNDNNRQVVKCDHCNYYFDLDDSVQAYKYIFPTTKNILVTQLTHKKNFFNYILSLNSRSPPLV